MQNTTEDAQDNTKDAMPRSDETQDGAQIDRDMRAVAKASGISVAGEIVLRPLGVAVVLLFTNSLGSVGYGVYAAVRSVMEMATEIANAGVRVGVLRYASAAFERRDREAEKSVVIGGYVLSVALSSLVGIGLAALARPISHLLSEPELVPYLYLASIGAPVLGVAHVVPVFATARRNVVPVVGRNIASTVALGVAFVVVVTATGHATAAGAIAAYVVAGGFAALTGSLLGRSYWRNLAGVPVRLRWPVLRDLLGYALPVGLGRAGRRLASHAIIPLTAAWLASTEVGHLAAGVRLALLQLTAAQWFQPVLPAILSAHLEAGRREDAARAARETARWASLVSVPAIVATVVCSRAVCRLLGTGFAGAERAVAVAACANIGVVVGALSGMQTLNMAGRQWVVTATGLVTGVISMGLLAILAPAYGAVGAASAFAASVVLEHAVYVVAVTRFVGVVPVHGYSWRYVLSALVAAVPALIVDSTSLGGAILQLAAFAAIYCGMVALIGVQPLDRQLMREAVSRLRGRRRATPGV